MKKISEIKNEDALDVLAGIIEPTVKIASDAQIKALRAKKDKMGALKYAMANYKTEILTILALLDGENPETYEVNLVQMPLKIWECFNDPDMAAFFASQGLEISMKSFGSATVNTEATETK